MTVMEMTQKELTTVISAALKPIVDRVNALAESLSRRLDALEKQAGPVGVRPSGYTGTISYGEPTIEEYMKAFDRAQPGSGGLDSCAATAPFPMGKGALTPATALEGAVRHHTTRLDDLLTRINALEEKAGPVGRPAAFQGVWQGSGGSDSDSKDALIRLLLKHAFNSTSARDFQSLRARAEKLGVKL